MLRILVRNAASNWMGYVVQAVVAFFLTPFVLHSLGDARYGIWALVIGLTGYYGLLDLGFRSGITQYMTRHLAAGDFARLNRTASTAFVALAVCGAAVFCLALVVSFLAPIVFTIPPEAVREARWAVVVIGGSMAFQFVCFPFSAVFTATQRYDITSAIGVSTRLLGAAATFAALKLGYGLVGLSVVNAAADLLGYSIRWRVAYRLIPELSISFRLANWQSFWPMTSYGIWALLINGAYQLKSQTSVLVIGLFMPIAAIAPFALVAGLMGYFDRLFVPIAMVFYPAATQLDARNEVEPLRTMYCMGSRVLLMLSITAGIIGAFWATDFFRLWVGSEYVEHSRYSSVALLFWILVPGAALAAGQLIGNQIFYATRNQRQIGLLLATEAVIGLTMSVCLISSLGLMGVAIAATVPTLLFRTVVNPLMLCRLLGIPGLTYFRRAFLRPLTIGVVLACLLAIFRHYTPPAGSWGELLAHGAVAVALAALPLLFIGIDRSERRRFVFQPFARIVDLCLRRKLAGSPRETTVSAENKG